MSRNEFICDCNVIHDEVVENTIKEMPKEDTFNKIAEFFKILGDTTRTKILFALDLNEMCVCDIANVLGMTKSSISHQLGTLRRMKIVKWFLFWSIHISSVFLIFFKGRKNDFLKRKRKSVSGEWDFSSKK